MSMKTKLLSQLQKKPATCKELQRQFGNNRLVASLLRELVRENKAERLGDVYHAAHAGREESVSANSGARMRKPAPTSGFSGKGGAFRPRGNGLACRMVRVSAGYGFAQPLNGTGNREEDVFIPGRYLHGVLPGDEVEVALAAHPRREGSREGEVVRLTQSAPDVTGLLEQQFGRLWLRPDFCPELLLAVDREEADPERVGEKVAAVLSHRGADYDQHRFSVQAYFGNAETAKACAQAILHEGNISETFPEKVLLAAQLLQRQAGGLSIEAPGDAAVPAEELEGRLDLRDEAIFTIDSAATKDIDDAISLQKTANGWALGVHIADVSHYVRPYTALDKEALARGTSVYYADRVAPMLPPQLSNDLCSLNENVERLAFSCLMQLNQQAEVTEFRFAKTVIRSRVKGVYAEINRLLDGEQDAVLMKKYAQVVDQLPGLKAVYEQLAKKRNTRGSMDIESGESKLILDAEGCCIEVCKRERGLAECIIEECMILANGCAARLARENQLPFVYRVHTQPEDQRVENLKKTLGALGVEYHFAGATPTQPELSALLDAARSTRLESAVHTAILRTMAKADYRPQPLGHYGLALQDYAHFTSPIRRYPDLAIHRILSDYCQTGSAEGCRRRYAEFARRASEQSSARELVAMTAERSCEDCYKAEYMRPKLGQEFTAIITSVTSFGVYVQLPNTVEGLVKAEALCTGAAELTEGVALTDTLTGRRWAVGDEVQVRLAAVSVPLGQIDFVPAQSEPAKMPQNDLSAKKVMPATVKPVVPRKKSSGKTAAVSKSFSAKSNKGVSGSRRAKKNP